MLRLKIRRSVRQSLHVKDESLKESSGHKEIKGQPDSRNSTRKNQLGIRINLV